MPKLFVAKSVVVGKDGSFRWTTSNGGGGKFTPTGPLVTHGVPVTKKRRKRRKRRK